MSPYARVWLGLRVLTVVFVIAALVALFWRPGVPATESTVAGFDAGGPALPPSAGATRVEGIIAANVFSSARRPPAVRYRPFASETDAAPAPVQNEATADPTGSAARGGVPQFFGTVAGPRGTFALLRLDASTPDAQLYREGDVAAGYRVVKINEQSVVLSGPRGRIELRLSRPGGPTP